MEGFREERCDSDPGDSSASDEKWLHSRVCVCLCVCVHVMPALCFTFFSGKLKCIQKQGGQCYEFSRPYSVPVEPVLCLYGPGTCKQL